MNPSYVIKNEVAGREFIYIKYKQILKDIFIFLTSTYFILAFLYLYPYINQSIITYFIGAIMLVTLVPISIRLLFKFILSLTIGLFVDIRSIMNHFSFGFSIFIIGFVMFMLFITFNTMTLFAVSTLIMAIGISLIY